MVAIYDADISDGGMADGVAMPDAPPAYQPDLSARMRDVDNWASLMEPALTNAMLCQDFFDDKQLTGSERKVLRDRGQPDVVMNRIKPAVNGIVGVIERGRSDPKALPRSPVDEATANLATDVLRYICDVNRIQLLKSTALSRELIWGWTASITEVTADYEVETTEIRPEEFIWDPASRRNDCRDARFLGIAKWVYVDELQVEYPQMSEDIANAIEATAAPSESSEDRPEWGFAWVDKKTRRVMVIEMYHRERGVWMRCKFLRNLALEAGPSPYVDPKTNEPRCPIEVVRAYVDRMNQPYGAVFSMLDAQREINMRRSKLLHELNVRQLIVTRGLVDDIEAVRKEAAKAGGVMVQDAPGGIEIVQRADIVSGQAMLLAEAKGEIERQGPNPGVLGRDVQGQSGRAILAQQQAGLLELAPILGAFDEYVNRIYRQMWMCAQQFWTAPKYIRVTDDVQAPQYIMVNEPILIEGPDGQPVFDQMGQPVVAGMKRSLAQLDVDIVIDSMPDIATIAEEQFATIAELLPTVAQLSPPLAIKMLETMVSSSTALRNDVKASFIEAIQQPQQADPAQMQAQQMAMQMEMEAAQSQIAKTQSETAKNAATAQKTTIEAANIMRTADREDAGVDGPAQDRMIRARQMAQRDGTPPPG